MIKDEIKNIKSGRKELREFGLVVGGVILVIGGFLLYRHRPAGPWFAGVGAVLVAFGLVAPALLKPLQKVWMAFAVLMGWFMTRLILGALFYLVFTPIGLGARIFGHSFMPLQFDKSADTYWIRREKKERKKEDYERQF
jgi:hypothetical protein